jgi:hypothetical protein
MKIISAILLAVSIAAPAMAADFTDLQGLKASGISRVNPFPGDNPDTCVLLGMQDGLCRFKCRSGETFQAKPVNPQASSVYEKCGAADYRGVKSAQVPPIDAGSIWSQINNQHNPFPQHVPSTLDRCLFTEFKNNKCLFKCESGAILTEPAIKPDFSTGEPAGACAIMIIRPIKPAFATKAAAVEQTFKSYGKYDTAQKAAAALNWAVNGLKSAKAEVTGQTLVVNGLYDYDFTITFRAKGELAIEPGPTFRNEQDAYERMFDMADRLENTGARVAIHEVIAYGPSEYAYIVGFFK